MYELQGLARTIAPLDEAVMEKIKAGLLTLVRPPSSLGRLEELLIQYGGIIGSAVLPTPQHCMVVACADHGVARNTVSAYPIETTVQMTLNYVLSRGASANAFANYCGANMVVVDAGVAADISKVKEIRHHKIAWGTADFTRGAAMSEQQAVRAVTIGIEVARAEAAKGYNCFSLGEMGIGNTTSSAAIASACVGLTPERAVGRGTGISDERLEVKLAMIRQALAVNKPRADDGLDVLTKIGGFETGVLAGVVIGAAQSRSMVIVDGLNTTVAALIAMLIAPQCRMNITASHLSVEPAHEAVLDFIGLKPCVKMDIRLGEAIGASVVMKMLTAAVDVYSNIAGDKGNRANFGLGE